MKNAEYGESIKTDNLSELVLSRIQQLIVNKEYRPGDYLPSEKELAERFGVGKSSVREAVKMLQVLGVVESKQGIGTRIKESIGSNIMTSLLLDLTLQQSTSQELLEFREMFEVAFTQLAASKATQQDKNMLREIFDADEEKYKNGTLTADDEIAFHKYILELTRNPFVIKIGSTILELLRPSIERSIYYSPGVGMEDHRMIVKAFCEGDQESIKKAVLMTLDTTYKMLLEIKDGNGAG